MSDEIKTAIKMKNEAYKKYASSGMRQGHYTYLKNLKTELSNWIHDTKFEYHRMLGAKLINPATSAKTY